MGKSTRKLFGSAVLSGLSLRLGLPGLADLIAVAWDTTRGLLAAITPATFLSLASLVIFLVIAVLTFDIYLKGARKGVRGLKVVVLGVICGFLAGSFILVAALQFMGS